MTGAADERGTPSLDRWAARAMGLARTPARADIECWQLAELRRTLAFARAMSPFYRRRADWPDAERLTTPADLALWPFTFPADLARAEPPLAAAPLSGVARVVTLATSGTGGASKRLFFTAEDLEATVDFFAAGMALFTRPGDRVAVLFPAGRPDSVGDLLARALNRIGAEARVPPTAAMATPETLLAELRRLRPDVIAGMPVTLGALARTGLADGGAPLAVRAVLASADAVTAPLAATLTAAWGSEVFEHWGMTETGYGGAVACPCHDGLHLREADLYVEIVDPATGAPLPEGEVGEIVVTTLRRRGLPLVRYRTGDLASQRPGPCRCGSPLRRLGPILGRIEAGAPPLDRARLEEAIFAVPGVVDFALAVRRAEGILLTVAIAARGDGAATAAAVRERLENLRRTRALSRERLQIDIRVADQLTGSIVRKRKISVEPDI